MTPARAAFEREWLPSFAARFKSSALVLNLGAGHHAYREYFPCRVLTSDADPAAGCDETFAAEKIPHADDAVDGVVLMGVFERLDDPMQALREVRRVLTPGGFFLFAALDLGTPYRKPCDRWRLTPGGAGHVIRAFTVLAAKHVADAAYFYVLQKP